jgi:hypothetical protein
MFWFENQDLFCGVFEMLRAQTPRIVSHHGQTSLAGRIYTEGRFLHGIPLFILALAQIKTDVLILKLAFLYGGQKE